MDEAAFRSLFQSHFGDVWRFARRRCSSADDADEVAADTFAVAWRRGEDLPAPDQVRMWLFGAARLVLANQRRSDRRRESLRQRVEAFGHTAPGVTDPATVVVDDGDNRLLEALASLTADERDLLIMRAWDGLTVAEMAALLGCSANAVSIRLNRARSRLAKALGEKDPNLARTSQRADPQSKRDRP